MEPLEIVNRLKNKYLNEIAEIAEFRDQVFVSVNRDRIIDICRFKVSVFRHQQILDSRIIQYRTFDVGCLFSVFYCLFVLISIRNHFLRDLHMLGNVFLKVHCLYPKVIFLI